MFYFHKLIYWGITLRSSLYKNPRKGFVIINTNLKKDRKKERKKEKGETNKNKHKTSRKSQLDKIYGQVLYVSIFYPLKEQPDTLND